MPVLAFRLRNPGVGQGPLGLTVGCLTAQDDLDVLSVRRETSVESDFMCPLTGTFLYRPVALPCCGNSVSRDVRRSDRVSRPW
jgi:hypothetical protein